MTNDEYADILAVHGRRVANRAVLSATPLDQRILSDFYDCYGPELPIKECGTQGHRLIVTIQDNFGLPEHERGTTQVIDTFDPTGWFAHYAYQTPPSWAEPPSAAAHDDDTEQVTDELIMGKVQQSSRLICLELAGLRGRGIAIIKERGNAMIDEHSQTLASRYDIDHKKVRSAVAQAVEDLLKPMGVIDDDYDDEDDEDGTVHQ